METKINIKGNLFQWEQDKKIYLENFEFSQPLYAQFFNSKIQNLPLVPIMTTTVLIPNVLLESSLPITVIICSEHRVIARKEFSILKRPQPVGYNNDQQKLEKINSLIGS